MVMSKQPEGMKRVKRATADGKAAEYTILFNGTEVGFSRRVVNGSVSTWEGYAALDDGSYDLFPSQHKDHNDLMRTQRDKWLERHPDGAAPAKPAADEGHGGGFEGAADEVEGGPVDPTGTVTAAAAGEVEVTEPGASSDEATAASVAGPEPKVVKPRKPRKSKAQRAAEQAEADAARLAEAERPPGHANPEAIADIEAAYAAEEGGTVAVIAGTLQDDGTVVVEEALVVEEGVPQAVFQAPSGGNPFADPLADPLGPAFVPR